MSTGNLMRSQVGILSIRCAHLKTSGEIPKDHEYLRPKQMKRAAKLYGSGSRLELRSRDYAENKKTLIHLLLPLTFIFLATYVFCEDFKKVSVYNMQPTPFISHLKM